MPREHCGRIPPSGPGLPLEGLALLLAVVGSGIGSRARDVPLILSATVLGLAAALA